MTICNGSNSLKKKKLAEKRWNQRNVQVWNEFAPLKNENIRTPSGRVELDNWIDQSHDHSASNIYPPPPPYLPPREIIIDVTEDRFRDIVAGRLVNEDQRV